MSRRFFLAAVVVPKAVPVQLKPEPNLALLTHPGCAFFAESALFPPQACLLSFPSVLSFVGGDRKVALSGGLRWASQWHAEQLCTQLLLESLACHWLLLLPNAELLVHNKAVSDSNVQKVRKNCHGPSLCFSVH